MITLLNLSPYAGGTVAPSPNYDARKAPAIEGIVLHATEDEGDETLSLSWLRSRKSRASCHLLVGRAGRVTRLVGDRHRAWHAGLSWWRGTSDVNSITLGVEIANRNDGEPYRDAQYRRVAEIVVHYCRQGLSLDDVVAHGEIADGRKTDPLGWDWERFRAMVQEQLSPASVRPPSPARGPDRTAAAAAPTAVQRVDALPKPQIVAPPRQRLDAPLKQRVVGPKPRVPVITTAKPVVRSRTLWLNTLTVLGAGSVIIGQALDLAFQVGLTLPKHITVWVLFWVGLVNIFFRLRTTQPLTCSQSARCSPGDVAMERSAARPGAVTCKCGSLRQPAAGDVAWPTGSQG